MPTLIRTARFVRGWLDGGSGVETREVILDRGDRTVPTTVVRPGGARDAPPWILLHGMTRLGRAHPQLARFSRALASTGAPVIIPEVPEWCALRLTPELTVPTVRMVLDALPGLDGVAAGAAPGLVGFSFGGPQAIAASAHPDIRDRLAGVVAFGGYCDLERTLTFQFTGHHEGDGTAYAHRPDHYGRWILAANWLAEVPGHEDAADVAAAFMRLAEVAGDRGAISWDPVYDPLKAELRASFTGRQRALFDLIEPPGGAVPSGPEAEALAHELARTARRLHPEMEPSVAVAAAPGPVYILHGRNDHLIPFTEAARLYAALDPDARGGLAVTRIFGHSARDPIPWTLVVPETLGFLRAMGRVLALV